MRLSGGGRDARAAARTTGFVVRLSAAAVAAIAVTWVVSLLVQQQQGPRESDRLLAIVEDLPGVSSAEGEGSWSISDGPAAETRVTMSSDATSEQLETVLLTWRSGANPGDTYTFEKWLSVSFDDGGCNLGGVRTTDQTAATQLEDTVSFLKAVCARAPYISVSVRDDRDERHVEVDYPECIGPDPLDLDQLRRLPGATTERDVWEVAKD